MGSIKERSFITKNNIDPRMDTLLYEFLVISMSFSISIETCIY
jgi:hypothetical protein